MRWKPKPNEWRRAFALLPMEMGDGTWVWLERYEYRLQHNYKGHACGEERRVIARPEITVGYTGGKDA